MPRPHIYTPRRGTGVPRREREDAVARIYRDDDGALPDFSRLDRRPPTWRRWAIGGGLIGLAALAAAAWAGFLIFKPYAVSSGGNVTVTVDTPTTAATGDEVVYRIRFANDDRVPIARAAIELRLPPDTVVIAADPELEDARALRWTIGTIAARADRTVTLRARLYGTPGNVVRTEATAVYRPANFNADFNALATAETTIAPSPLRITITGPERAAAGQSVAYTIAYEHTGATPLPPLALLIETPRAFTLAEATPARPRADELRWPIGELAPQAKGTVTIRGAFAGDAKGALAIRAVAAVELADRRTIAQADATATTEVLGGDIVLTATANDQTAPFNVRAGDAIRFRIAVRNDGDAELRDLTVRAVFDATSVNGKSILDFNRIVDAHNGSAVGEQLTAERRRGTVTWTVAEVADLASLKPKEQRTLDLTLPVHTAATLPGFSGSGELTFSAAITAGATGTVAQPRTVQSPPVTIAVRPS